MEQRQGSSDLAVHEDREAAELLLSWGRWLWGPWVRTVWRGAGPDGRPASFFRHGQATGEHLFKSAFKFSNLISARSYPVILQIPDCPQRTFPIKPVGRLGLSASRVSLNLQLGTSPHKGSGPRVCTHTHEGLSARCNPFPSWVKHPVFCDSSP